MQQLRKAGAVASHAAASSRERTCAVCGVSSWRTCTSLHTKCMLVALLYIASVFSPRPATTPNTTNKQAELLLSDEAQERASVSDLKLQLQDLQAQVDQASQVCSCRVS